MASIVNPENLIDNITFRRYSASSSFNTRIYWEIIEYSDYSGDRNEFVVRDQDEITQSSGTQMDGSSVGVNNDSNVVVFITGQRHDSVTSSTIDRGLYTAEWVSSSDVPRFTRGDGTGSSSLSYAVVEFMGENWKVQRVEHTYVGITMENESINVVNDVNKTFIHAQMRTASGNLDEQGQQVWLYDNDTVSFELITGDILSQVGVAWVMENTQKDDGTPAKVQHIGSNTRASGGAEPDQWTENIQNVDTNMASVMAETAVSGGTASATPRGSIGFQITASNTLTLWRSDTGQTQYYRYEILEWPTVSPPSINNINATPDPVTFYSYINISANVTDDYNVSSVLIEVRKPDNTKTNYTASNTSSLYYNNTINTTQTGIHYYKIYARDNAGNWKVSSEYNFEVWFRFNITVNTTSGQSLNTNISIYNSSGSLVAQSKGNLSVLLEPYKIYDVVLETPLSSGIQSAYFENMNISQNLVINSQVVETYSGTLPDGIANVTPVYAQDFNGDYDYVTLYLPKASLNVTRILHCTNWNYSSANCSSWEINQTSDYDMQENSTYVWFNVTEFDAFGGGEKAYLEVYLNRPPDITIVPWTRNFTINATVMCRLGNCGLIRGYARYNASGSSPDTDISTTIGVTPFYTFDSNPQQISLQKDENSTMIWKVNSTANLGKFYEIGVYFETSQLSNHTENNTIEIGKVLVMNLTFDTINFGVLNPGQNEKPALNNSNEYYNISIDKNSNDLDYLWIKSEDLVGEAWPNYKVKPGNISWSFTNNPSTGSGIGYSYSLMDSNVPSGQNKTTYYWINVPYSLMAQSYVGEMTIMANASW